MWPIARKRPGGKCLLVVAVLAGATGCGAAGAAGDIVAAVHPGATAHTAVGEASRAGKRARLIDMVKPSRLVAEIEPDAITPWLELPGRTLFVTAGLRFIRGRHGPLERSSDRFPAGTVQALELPERLGGGYLYYQSDGQGTRLWRADDWTSKLRPLARINDATAQIVAGFDRVYLRSATGRLTALDVDDGAPLPLGGLPPAVAYGAMAFADGWRGIVDTDFTGPLASFDAGASWHPVPLERPPIGAGVVKRDPVFFLGDGRLRIDADGQLQWIGDASSDGEDEEDGEARVTGGAPPRPLGDHPLRVAIERGWPDTRGTAIVGYRGVLARVRLRDGVVLALRRRLLEDEQTDCQAARVGRGFGFICGSGAGDTVVYAFVPPLDLREVARFTGPRFVSPSGNGALVVRGGCDAGSAPREAGKTLGYCVIGIDGRRTEVRIRGQLGAERLVALQDGRVVVLVPPRRFGAGRLNLIAGSSVKTFDLKLPSGPKRALQLVKQGLWMDGFQQTTATTIGGWVEAGGPVVGVTVGLDGKVALGKLQDEGDRVLLSGPRALAITDAEVAFESIDGGRHWDEVELPGLPESRGDDPTRGCSPVGCALRGWLRVGWGPAGDEDDLATVAMPETMVLRHESGEPLRLRCRLAHTEHGAAQGAAYLSRGKWLAFRGVPPPALGAGQIGVDKGSEVYEKVPARAYVWGPKGADWTRAGWWQVRFDNRFDAGSGVVQSAPSRPPWPDRSVAAGAIGARRRGSYWRWSATLDPSGRSAVVTSCMGSRCVPFAVTAGQPVMPLTPTMLPGSFPRPQPFSVVRLADSWYLLRSSGRQLSLWRARLGALRKVGDLWRLAQRQRAGGSAPRLVRRVFGRKLGLLLTVPPDPGARRQVGRWLVLPIDENTGAALEPVDLGPTDLGGVLPPRCGPHDGGWQIIVQPSVSPVFTLQGARGYLDTVELSLRHQPGSACLQAIAARTGRALQLTGSRRGGADPSPPLGIGLSVTGRSDGRRWRLRCGLSRSSRR